MFLIFDIVRCELEKVISEMIQKSILDTGQNIS